MGLKDIVAVSLDDAVLVANLTETQSVGKIVKNLKTKTVSQSLKHRKDFRPWGWYQILISVPGKFQVKNIYVKPGGILSLQSHSQRSENWIVVEGEATVTIGEDKKLLKVGESAFIKKGEIHRLENISAKDLKIIEVQTGSYFGEDDIIRYEDVYSRS